MHNEYSVAYKLIGNISSYRGAESTRKNACEHFPKDNYYVHCQETNNSKL